MLKPKKCIMILTVSCTSEENKRVYKEWLTKNIPDWANFKINAASKYLGIFLGPKAGALQWKAPMVKFYDRVDQIYRQKLPPSLAGARYGTHGVSVMGYVGQFMPPPRNFMAIELATASKVLHMATNALDTSAVFSLELVGGPKLVRPLHFLFSALSSCQGLR